jgi:EVE domain
MNSVKHWLAVASAEHIRRGHAEGFMQVCHGKRGPLARLHAGDGIVYYSPGEKMGGKSDCKSFTALGRVTNDIIVQHDMGGGFVPFRRSVNWLSTREQPIAPLMHLLELTAGNKNWGYQLRFGLIEFSPRDFAVLEELMV